MNSDKLYDGVEMQELKERLFEAERNIIDLHDQLAVALDYFEDREGKELEIYRAASPVWSYADAYVKKYQLNYKDFINNTPPSMRRLHHLLNKKG